MKRWPMVVYVILSLFVAYWLLYTTMWVMVNFYVLVWRP